MPPFKTPTLILSLSLSLSPMATTISCRKSSSFRSTFCCSFAYPPSSPDITRSTKPPPPHSLKYNNNSSSSFHSSPSNLRRILSPGRVSPIDSDPPRISILDSVNESADPLPLPPSEEREGESAAAVVVAEIREDDDGSLDLRVRLNGRDGGVVVLEVDSRVLCGSSSWFEKVVVGLKGKDEVEIEVEEDLEVWKETVEMMYEKDEMAWLMKAGVSRSIDVLDVSSKIMFNRGVMSCLNYIEAVPWSGGEEEKLKKLFARCTFDEAVTKDILARLQSEGPSGSEDLAIQLIQSIADGNNSNARKELQSLVTGLLSESSVYQKDPAGLNRESLYNICHSCLNSLVELFKDEKYSKQTKPLVERVAKQVENINWVLEILMERHMAEDFVHVWADQKELINIHQRASPMVRYELSRISACVFTALGKGKLQCPGDVRSAVLEDWFGPMMLDFGWLQRCPKGLDIRMLEEGLGQALLMLPLKQQQSLFVEWFRCVGRKGTECPNLSKAFQVWWRRSFVRVVEVQN